MRIAASGDLDEFSIHELLDSGAPIDSFGVGTSIGVGAGSVERDIEGGALGGVYKEVYSVDARGAHPKVKVAGDKSTWPGIKEVYRIGHFVEDVIQLADEPKPLGSERLFKPVVLGGDVVPGSLPPLSEIWEFAQSNLRRLPDEYRQLVRPRCTGPDSAKSSAAFATRSPSQRAPSPLPPSAPQFPTMGTPRRLRPRCSSRGHGDSSPLDVATAPLERQGHLAHLVPHPIAPDGAARDRQHLAQS